MCDTHNQIQEDNVCMFINETKNKLHLIKPCSDPDFPVCDYSTVAFGTPAYCVPKEAPQKTLAGESCSTNDDCYSGRCVSRICQGNAWNTTCATDNDCGVGLFCSWEGRCANQQLFGQNCTRDFDCTNNCACNKGTCVYYYSFDNFLEADNPVACASGYIENGQCYPALTSRYKGRPCTNDDECVAYNHKGELVQYGECQCGYNGGGFTYCTLAEGDPEFSQMKDKFAFIVARGFYCHTRLRFGPCNQLYDDEYREYQVAIRYFREYPQLIFNDPCIKRSINTEFWNFAGGEKIAVSLGLLMAIVAIFV